MTSATRALLVWNPVSGSHRHRRRRQVGALGHALHRAGWKVETAATTEDAGALPATRLALESACDVVVACGGDGTLNAVVNALVPAVQAAGGGPTLAVAPMGTANIMAHALRVPAAPAALARWLTEAQPRPFALGRARPSAGPGVERYFLAVASAGFDARVVHELAWDHKLRWGKLAYCATAARLWRTYRPQPLTLALDAVPAAADMVIFSLTPYYGGHFRLGTCKAGEALVLGLRGGRGAMLRQALRLATGGLERAAGVARFAATAVRIDTPGIAIELDGEAAGFTPVQFDIAPLMVPMLCHAAPAGPAWRRHQHRAGSAGDGASPEAGRSQT